MRFVRLLIGSTSRINMRSHHSGRRPRRSRGGSRRRGDRQRHQGGPAGAPKKTFWQRIAAFFGNGKTEQRPAQQGRNGAQVSRPVRKPEPVEVTSPRLYVGNLSFDATESDLFDLFNGV